MVGVDWGVVVFFGGVLAPCSVVGVNFLEVFLTEKQSVSQMIDLVVTIDSVQKSSKTELSSRGRCPFKVRQKLRDVKNKGVILEQGSF